MRAYVAAALLAAVCLAVPLAAGAAVGDRFTATIAPNLVQVAERQYTIAIKNQPNSPSTPTQATIAIPGGFTIVPQVPTVSGCEGNNTWAATLGQGTIDLTAVAGSLCERGILSVSFDATEAPGDGSYPWTVTIPGFTGDSPTLTVDGSPPDTSISGPPPTVTNSSASFVFTGSDGGSGLAGFECSLDGVAFASCTSPVSYTDLADGSHTFAVRALDTAGTPDPSPASWTWTVDATAPTPPVITAAPSDPSADRTPQFLFTDADPTAQFSCQLDGGAFASCPGSFTTPPLPDGPHTFGVKAIDPAGNASDVTSYSWRVDTVHALASITSAPPLLTNETTATFSFQANRPTSTFRCSLDGSASTACSSPRVYDDLKNGSHTFAVRAVFLGVPGPPTEYTWTVDTVAPQTSIASAPPAASQADSATFTFTSSEPDSTFTCRLDGGGFVPCTSPKTYSGLGDGRHTFSVQAVDRAGNADASAASYVWTITGVGPPTQDLRPPANVRGVKRNVGYGRLQLRWRNPLDKDFDHVAVFVSTKRAKPPRTLLYTGRRASYTNKRFKNGLYYRFLVVTYDRAENASGGTPVTVSPSALLVAPRNGGTVRKAPTFRWAPVRRATFYNIQLYYRGGKVLSTWPGKARQRLSPRWTYANRSFQLRRGLYVWYVWPGFGPRSKARYGQLLGQGTFRVR